MELGHKLTNKQIQFVQEYLIDLNATQACIRAGYSQGNADKIGSELLGKTRVSEAIQMALKERSKRVEITADKVLTHLEEVRCIAMKRVPMFDRGGNQIGEDLNDKNSALKAIELLGRHLGMWLDRKHITGDLDQRFKFIIRDGSMAMEKCDADG